MQSSADLKNLLDRIDHRGYPAYKDTKGEYQFPGYVLSIDHVQGDPFAAPSKLSIHVKGKTAAFPKELYQERRPRIALQDGLTRLFGRQAEQVSFKARGSGQSGLISVSRCGQEILERTACAIDPQSGDLILRLEVGFPANGRTINSKELEKILFEFLPGCVKNSLFYPNLDAGRLRAAADLAEDQQYIREQLPKLGLCAFVANGSILPRESGVSSRPMKNSVPFQSPKELEVVLTLPHKGKLAGMGIRKGVSLIVGGGYHGKSTLLKALELGVYDHIAGDGREYVITDETAVKIRAEDGRSVLHTDISLFINHLPNGQDTTDFSTENASGSTSQAANLIEALETGSRLLLLDEDTSATNFMIRDKVMARLVSDDREPITTLLRHIRSLYEKHGISFVIVVGSSGDYLSVADHVLQMDHYETKDVTQAARAICREEQIDGQYPAGELAFPVFSRALQPARAGRLKMKAMGTDTVLIDREAVDVRYLEQLSDDGQTVGLAYLMNWILTNQKAKMPVAGLLDEIYDQIEKKGFGTFVPPNYSCGHPVLPRKQELFACLNRYRKARIVRE